MWWEHPYITVGAREACCVCDEPCPAEHYLPYVGWGRGDRIQVYAHRACARCVAQEVAMLEAKDEGRQYVTILPLRRCVCGNAALAITEECVPCSRQRRMLDREWSDLKLARRLLRDVKRELRSRAPHDGEFAQAARRDADRLESRKDRRGNGSDDLQSGARNPEVRRGADAVRADATRKRSSVKPS